jgi:hypothetical protein
MHLRFNELDDPEPVPVGTEYASVIESDVPIVVQHTGSTRAEPRMRSSRRSPSPPDHGHGHRRRWTRLSPVRSRRPRIARRAWAALTRSATSVAAPGFSRPERRPECRTRVRAQTLRTRLGGPGDRIVSRSGSRRGFLEHMFCHPSSAAGPTRRHTCRGSLVSETRSPGYHAAAQAADRARGDRPAAGRRPVPLPGGGCRSATELGRRRHRR